jgi:tetratricopeptide (TPR) repeat protein
MVGMAWLGLRQAQEALKNGRLDEAQRLLSDPAVQGHKGTGEMLQQLAQAFVERGERHLRRDDPEPAWQDLQQAEQVGTLDTATDRLRQALVRKGLADVQALLAGGDPNRATEAIQRLRERSVRHPDLRPLEDAAGAWVQAQQLADHGEFARAVQVVGKVRQLLPSAAAPLQQFERELDQRRGRFADLVLRLHEAMKQGQWREVIPLTDEVLAVAPQHPEARKARQRAWQAVEPATVAAGGRTEVATLDAASPRFLLWIDGVGGYLVCLGQRVTIGQATPEIGVDVPLLADISRLHAQLSRDAEGYLFEALRPAQINGKAADKVLLQADDRLTLGNVCQLQFRQPVPVSASARLDLASGHRLHWAVDAVLLMADTLVLGPGGQVHVDLPDVTGPIVLYRHKDGLGIRCPGPFTIDGQRFQERGLLGEAASVKGEEFAFAVEPIRRSQAAALKSQT